jgi:D-alanine-D-alanine ligase
MVRRRIAVLAGGVSPERDISLVSGSQVHRALEENGHEVSLIAIDSLDELVPRLRGVESVFNCLHGGAGEDGTVQLLLDVMGIRYAGSGARACFRAMDKPRALALFNTHGIPIPRGITYHSGDLARFLSDAADRLAFPLVLKPGNAGSTVSVFFIEEERQLRPAADSILAAFPSLVVEEYIEGREVTVGILRQEGVDAPLPVIEIRIPGKLFDRSAKYTEGVAEFLAPAPIEAELAERLQSLSLRAHAALGCSGFSRVDIRLADDGTPYILEVNALPGMTPMSDLPRAAALAGIPYPELVEMMLRTADEKEERGGSSGSGMPASSPPRWTGSSV